MSRNRVIGREGALPWRMPADLKRFKQRTLNHAVIMGRRTWATMTGPLEERTNIVITRDARFVADGAIVTRSLEDALAVARRARPEAGEIFIVGGAEIYRLALPLADRIDLTLIEADFESGDTFFPVFEDDPSWALTHNEPHAVDERNPHAYRFMTYERQRDARPRSRAITGVRAS